MPTVTPVPADHPEVERLVAALLRELSERYDDDSETIARTDPGASWVLLLDDDGTAVGCGAVQRLSKSVPGAPDDHGEIKRVFVERRARGRGLSRVLMDALLDVARGRGCTWLQLETGDVQPEAIGLYESSGWHRVPNYGQYVDDPRSVCFGRSLAQA